MIIGKVVIADDHINTQRLRISDHFHRLNTAIQRYHERIAIAMRIVYALFRYTIPFAIAVWYIIRQRSGVFLLQERINNCYGRSTVDVIVAIHHDTFMPLYCFCDPVYCFPHSLHQERIMQVCKFRTKKETRAFIVFDAACGQQPAYRGLYL